MNRLLSWTLDTILRNPILFWAAIVTNVAAAIWGAAVWYGPMLAASPLLAWPFIPDCPLAALYASAALLAIWAGRRWPALTAFAAFACIKYGVWTIAFWSKQWLSYGVGDIFEVVLFVTHIGLLCEGLLLATRIGPIGLPTKLTILGWYLLSLFVDYGLGFHPPLAAGVPVEFVFAVAALMTALLGAALLALPGMLPAQALRQASGKRP